jgi:hypothetical protein
MAYNSLMSGLGLVIMAAAVTGMVASCGPHHPPPPPGGRTIVSTEVACQAWVGDGSPFTLSFVLRNPSETGALVVPRVLHPLGAFVSLQIVDAAGAAVYESHPPKFTPKLAPDARDAYVTIDPGYSYGTTFVEERIALPAGDYEVRVAYSNLYFRGTADQPIGDQKCSTVVRYQRR